MAHYTFPYFGRIDLEVLEEYYDSELDYNGYSLHLDLNFEGTAIALSKADKIKAFLDRIARIDSENRKSPCA